MAFDIFITLFLVTLNGFFVAAEFAIVKVRASKIEMKAQAGNRAAILSSSIISHLDGYLAATQLGITLASLGLGWVGEPVVSKIILAIMYGLGFTPDPELAHNIALPIAFAFITVLHIVFGELAPKSMAIQRPEKTTLWVAYPLNVFYIVFRPFIWMLNGIANVLLKMIGINAVHGSEVHSADELKFLVQQTSENEGEESTDFDIIKNAFDFSERSARQIMIPRTRLSALNISKFKDADFEKYLDEGYSRIPCYEESIDNVTGVVYLKDMMTMFHKKGRINVAELIRPVIFVPENKNVSILLKEFQQKHIHMAIVINEFGGTEGIVTMEDIIEELVGEIQDETDNEIPIVETVSDQVYNVVATAGLHDINQLLPDSIAESEKYDTLAGFIIHKFGKIPNTNDKLTIDGYEITVLKKVKNTIALVQLKKETD